MTPRRMLTRMTVASLAAAALAAPAATALPTDPTGPRPDDMHVQKDARQARVPAQPEWPIDSHVLGRSHAQLDGASGNGEDEFPAALVVIGATLVLGGGVAAAAAMRSDQSTAPSS